MKIIILKQERTNYEPTDEFRTIQEESKRELDRQIKKRLHKISERN